MALMLGIDLGTTNSLGAYMTEGGPVVLRDAEGSALVASVIGFGPDGVVVGAEARAHAVANPLGTIHSVKRLMGKSLADLTEDLRFLPYPIVEGPHETVRVKVGAAELTPQELSAMILREVKTRAEATIGQEITEAVITVPAYFDVSTTPSDRPPATPGESPASTSGESSTSRRRPHWPTAWAGTRIKPSPFTTWAGGPSTCPF